MIRTGIILCLLIFLSCTRKIKLETKRSIPQGVSVLQELDNETAQIQLSEPQIHIDSIMFIESSEVKMELMYPGANIFYSINQNSPKKYSKPVIIDSSSHIEIIAKAENFISSDTLSVQLVKVENDFTNAEVSFPFGPDEAYPGDGPNALVDLKKGSLNFREGNYWLGFKSHAIVQIDLKKPMALEKIKVSLLSDHGSWIFLPKEIKVKGNKYGIGKKTLDIPLENTQSSLEFIEIEINEGIYQHLEIFIECLESIPEWHPGAGTPPWLFIDEILFE